MLGSSGQAQRQRYFQQQPPQYEQYLQQQQQPPQPLSSQQLMLPIPKSKADSSSTLLGSQIPQNLSNSMLDSSKRSNITPTKRLSYYQEDTSSPSRQGDNFSSGAAYGGPSGAGYGGPFGAAYGGPSQDELEESIKGEPRTPEPVRREGVLFRIGLFLENIEKDLAQKVEGTPTSKESPSLVRTDDVSPSPFNQQPRSARTDEKLSSSRLGQSMTPPIPSETVNNDTGQSPLQGINEGSFRSTPEIPKPRKRLGQSIGKNRDSGGRPVFARDQVNILLNREQFQTSDEEYKEALKTLKKIAKMNGGIPNDLVNEVKEVVEYFVAIINDDLSDAQQGSHVIRIDPSIKAGLSGKVLVKFKGGHLGGTSENLQEFGLVKISKKVSDSNGSTYYLLINPFSGHGETIEKTEFPTTWKPADIIGSIKKALKENITWAVDQNDTSGWVNASIKIEGVKVNLVAPKRNQNIIITAYPVIENVEQLLKEQKEKQQEEIKSKKEDQQRLDSSLKLESSLSLEDFFGSSTKPIRKESEVRFIENDPSKNLFEQMSSGVVASSKNTKSRNLDDDETEFTIVAPLEKNVVDRNLFSNQSKPVAKISAKPAAPASNEQHLQQYVKREMLPTTKSVEQQQRIAASSAAATALLASSSGRTPKVLSLTPKKQQPLP